jgi:aryl-alcohol dehydrogenase-like predicted oxidoreductase
MQVSEIGLGGHEFRRRSLVSGGRFTQLDPDRPAIVDAALQAGVNYFDTTFTEEAQSLGAALQAVGAKREEIIISGMSIDMLKRLEHVEPAKWSEFTENEVTERLQLLHTDYLDIFMICAMEAGYTTERLEGALEGLQRVKEKGLIRHVGASCHEPDLLATVIRERDPFAMAMTPFNYTKGPCTALMNAVRERDVGFVAFKPFVWFEYGVPFLSICRRIIESHGIRGATAAQMALRWILQFPEVATVIPAANSREELIENVAAFNVDLADVDTALLESCRNITDRVTEMVNLLDHPHEEVRTFAHFAVRDAAGADFGTDKQHYIDALKRRSSCA